MIDYLTSKSVQILENLEKVWENTSILLHHDSITGTSSTSNLNDYWDMINKINKEVLELEKEVDISFIKGNNVTTTRMYQVIKIFNPSPYSWHQIVNISIESPFVRLFNEFHENVIESQVTKLFTNPSNSDVYLLFWEVSLDPLSVNYFYYEVLSEEKCSFH